MPAITVDLPADLYERLIREARTLGKRPQDRVRDLIDLGTAPAGSIRPVAVKAGLEQLRAFIEQIPSVRVLGGSDESETYWWLKLDIDIHSQVAWHVVQELGAVLNYLSLEERLPTVFMPVSPPPYLNGGPGDFLTWAIEAKTPYLDAGMIARVLKDRLPDPIDDLHAWLATDADEREVGDDEGNEGA